MVGTRWRSAVEQWAQQELALFARRAHRQLGRGFVLLAPDEVRPIYVTWIVGAPLPLINAVHSYDPEREALVVCSNIDDEEGAVTVSRVRIDSCH